ncbi:MAG: ATP-binding protein [Defluviitaleaceae bacterium]|nr:ATP-binding protein [Defluviitaleaceae bacterium]
MPQACVGCSLRAAVTPRHCLLVLRQKSSQIHYGFMADKALGYVSFDKSSADLLFNLISSRNHKGSIIMTTNLTFDRCEEIFHDPTLAATIADRLAYKCHILNISREKSGRFEETMEWLNNKRNNASSDGFL